MERGRFTFNAFLLVVALASALYLFISVISYDIVMPYVRNDVYPLEGTEYAIKYVVNRTNDESGLYAGSASWDELLVPGNFGYDWGAVVEGDLLFCNEYHKTKLGFTTCDLVKIDLTTLEKTLIARDTMLLGRCASGELVCMGDTVPADWLPATNPLYDLYRIPAGHMQAETYGALVRFYDPADGSLLREFPDEEALTSERQEYYLSSSFAEVKEP